MEHLFALTSKLCEKESCPIEKLNKGSPTLPTDVVGELVDKEKEDETLENSIPGVAFSKPKKNFKGLFSVKRECWQKQLVVERQDIRASSVMPNIILMSAT